MNMEKITIEVYGIGELKQEARAHALEELRQNWDVDLEFFKDDALEQIREAGFSESDAGARPELRYSLGYSQGDGLSFTIKNLDIRAYCKKNRLLTRFRKLLRAFEVYEADAKIEDNSSHYSHERSVRTWINTRGDNAGLQQQADALEAIIEEARMQLCRTLAAQGYKEIESQLSDESLKEDAKANEYRFLKSGKRTYNI